MSEIHRDTVRSDTWYSSMKYSFLAKQYQNCQASAVISP
jgi:hypothetical protein